MVASPVSPVPPSVDQEPKAALHARRSGRPCFAGAGNAVQVIKLFVIDADANCEAGVRLCSLSLGRR